MSGNRIVVRNVPDQRIPVKNDVPVYLNSTIVKKIITSNGTYRAAEEKANGYDPVVVDVPTYEAENAQLTAEVAELTETVAAKTAEITQLEAEVGEAFDRGYAEGDTEGYEKGKTDGVAEGIEQGYADARQFTNGVTAITFDNLNLLGCKEFEIHLPLITSYYLMFRCVGGVANKTVEHITISGGSAKNIGFFLDSPFAHYESTLKRVTLNFDTSGCTNFQNSFACRMGLEVIDGQPLNCSSAKTGTPFSLTFNYCYALKEIRFVPNTIYLGIDFVHSNLLSAESIQSIIDGLADLTGATGKNIRFHKDVGPKLTDVQKATITAKNWTLVY